MSNPIQSIIDAGSKVWLDSVDPDEITRQKPWGISGATSNPKIVADLVASGRFDQTLNQFFDQSSDDEEIAWWMTDRLVGDAQREFADVCARTNHDDGWVSFELDPLLEDPELGPDAETRTRHYIELAAEWSADQDNRMIKIPATEAGLAALEEVAARGVTINVTLMFTMDQYLRARDAIWRGRQRYGDLDRFKSVYSIFVSRVDVYTHKHVPELSEAAQGKVGITNAKRIWHENHRFWADKNLPLKQELIFASTGPKLGEPADHYIDAFTGDGILTNPPETNHALAEMDRTFSPQVATQPDPDVIKEIDATIDIAAMHKALMDEGVVKFADPHKELIANIGEKRKALAQA